VPPSSSWTTPTGGGLLTELMRNAAGFLVDRVLSVRLFLWGKVFFACTRLMRGPGAHVSRVCRLQHVWLHGLPPKVACVGALFAVLASAFKHRSL